MELKLDVIDIEVIGKDKLLLLESSDGIAKLYVDSTNINAIWYDDTTGFGIGTLSIEFHSGAVYEYYRFPTVLFERFLRAPSFGKFMWKYIRGRYPYRRVS